MRRFLAPLAALSLAAGMQLAAPQLASASATQCATPWNSSAVYTGGAGVSYNGHNWKAKWWTQNQAPGQDLVWADQGACGGTQEPPQTGDFVVGQTQFEQMFPSRNSFYTYSGLTTAAKAYPAFAGTGSDTVKKQEAAAFLANVNHETGGLVYIVEQNTGNYPHYCDRSQPYGCPAGQAAYYGRGPIQLSWNFNYKAAGDALGIDLLNNPYLVERDAAVAWKTALWYWMTQDGPGTMTPHEAMVNGRGFGETIRSINGGLECNGGNPGQVESRVNAYKKFTQLLNVPPGDNLYC
ncbi:glycoside hydrolase family 19 protein [Actinomadura sp. NEAU-AAG7]|uniref:glycoside hydrolase family 19 protein n=1 Tax=Actinomadura sp. NEAU-AAG7 TaxID=2839640 RepID=UPI0027DEB2B4|nr:glycoside hydrolase family 19 protein [Actinomadura sp. NEAU-AAG7]